MFEIETYTNYIFYKVNRLKLIQLLKKLDLFYDYNLLRQDRFSIFEEIFQQWAHEHDTFFSIQHTKDNFLLYFVVIFLIHCHPYLF